MVDRDLKGEKIEEVENGRGTDTWGEKNLRNSLAQPTHSTEGESEAQSLASSPIAFPAQFVLWGWANLTGCHKIKTSGLKVEHEEVLPGPTVWNHFFRLRL